MLIRKALLILIVVSSLQVQAQSKIDTVVFIPSIDSCKSTLRSYYRLKSEAEEIEFKYKTKFKFLRFLPSVGWDLFRQSPIVSINTNSIYNEINRKRERNAKLKGIQKINEVQYNQDLVNVIFLLSTLKKEVVYYNNQLNILNLETERFQIIQKAYDNHELVPSEYLTKKIEFENFKSAVKLLEIELHDSKNKILTIAKQAPWESLY